MNMNSPLLDRIADFNTLQTAWRKVAGKGAAGGIDGQDVNDFACSEIKYLKQIRQDILEHRYEPEPTRTISIPKGPGKTGRRELGLPTVRDKIVQEATRFVLEPMMERLFKDCSYGYRPNKGPRKAIARVDHILNNLKRPWVVVADIDDFFGTINHDKLAERLRSTLQDEEVLRMLLLWLKMGSVDRTGRWRDVYSGLRQGNVISPLLANFYLTPFDQFMEDRGYALVRYADDMRFFTASQDIAQQALAEATDYLKDELRLGFNQNLNPIMHNDDGFDFLGIVFRGGKHLLNDEKLVKMRTKMDQLSASGAGFSAAMKQMNETVQGWRRYYAQVVEAGELVKLEDIQKRGLERAISSAFQKMEFKTLYEAEQAAQGVELIVQRDAKEREEFLKALVQKARQTARQRVHPSNDADVERLVRKKKRIRFQQTAMASELVVNTPGCFIGKDSQRVIVRKERRNIGEILITHLDSITVAGRGVALSADVVSLCADNNIPLIFLGPRGEANALLSAPYSVSAAIGTLQLQALNYAPTGLNIARLIVTGKIKNQMNLLKYLNKYRKNVDGDFARTVEENLTRIESILQEAPRIATDDYEKGRGQLFSIEGRAASCYWQSIQTMLKNRTDFPGRERRHAKDIVNSLLNYGYAVLSARVHLAITKSGLFPNISFLHCSAHDKPTLVFDMMEEFRPQVVDRTVWTLLGRRENLAVGSDGLLTDETRKTLIAGLQERLASLVRFRGKELKLSEIIQLQAKSLVRHLEGKEQYRPFLGKW
jgi:group II intron reverse transcriptase/maturase/CRISPR-associated endonuclease Cas1